MTRHDRGYGVLVDELRVPVAPQQHAKIVEPGHHALQLDAVHQEYRERRLVLAYVVEEGVLQVLGAVGRHRRCSVIRSRRAPRDVLVPSLRPSSKTPARTWQLALDCRAP